MTLRSIALNGTLKRQREEFQRLTAGQQRTMLERNVTRCWP
jgi:hypothetical protein